MMLSQNSVFPSSSEVLMLCHDILATCKPLLLQLNHRMGWVGRELKNHLVLPCYGQEHLAPLHVAPSPVPPGPEHSQGLAATASLGNRNVGNTGQVCMRVNTPPLLPEEHPLESTELLLLQSPVWRGRFGVGTGSQPALLPHSINSAVSNCST